ncbi:MAG: hypothetical protein KGY50_05535 [Candidatus Thermoplasmatota archaeon]|nr:hypothetical protein [Candidatus Thermoplasmatota archaeon]
MKQKKYKTGLMLFSFSLLFSVILVSVPMVSSEENLTVTIQPDNPKPKETVTFTATIPDVDNIQQVNIHVEECSNEICFIDDFNETMAETSENTYTATITLRHEDANYFRYELNYLTENDWVIYPESKEMIKIDLDTSDQTNDDTGGNAEDTSSDTPGFETIALFISVIFILLMLYRRRR